jgi:sortase A
MRDKRPVDELSIEELERILAIRKREARLARLGSYEKAGRRLPTPAPTPESEEEPEDRPPQPIKPMPLPLRAPKLADPEDFEGAPRFEDEAPALSASERKVVRWRDRILLGVELAAVLGIFYLLYTLYASVQSFTEISNQNQANAQLTLQAGFVQPTATPIINLTAVLPEGHTVTLDANGNVIDSAFNLDEIPAQFRASYSAGLGATYIPPTASSEAPVRLTIPKLGLVDKPVVEGDSWEALKLGVGHHLGSANPGQVGNLVLSAHDDVYGELFRYLDKLEQGDEVTIYTLTGQYTYIVRERRVVAPTETSVLDPQGAIKQLTLISCYPYQKDTQRIVVFAILKEN